MLSHFLSIFFIFSAPFLRIFRPFSAPITFRLSTSNLRRNFRHFPPFLSYFLSLFRSYYFPTLNDKSTHKFPSFSAISFVFSVHFPPLLLPQLQPRLYSKFSVIFRHFPSSSAIFSAFSVQLRPLCLCTLLTTHILTPLTSDT